MALKALDKQYETFSVGDVVVNNGESILEAAARHGVAIPHGKSASVPQLTLAAGEGAAGGP